MTSERFMTTREVAQLLRVDPSTVKRWALAGRLTAIRIGKDFRIESDSVDDLIRKSRVS